MHTYMHTYIHAYIHKYMVRQLLLAAGLLPKSPKTQNVSRVMRHAGRPRRILGWLSRTHISC